MPIVLVATVLDGQCTTNRVGYQWSWLLRWQGDYNFANGVGSYIGGEITILPMVLALMVPDAQCTTNGVGSYIDGWNIDNFLF